MDLNRLKTLDYPYEQMFGMKVGRNHNKCPGGDHKSTSLQVRKNGQVVWKCHKCGEGGSIIDATMKAFGVNEHSAIKMLEGRYGEAKPKNLSSTTSDYKKVKLETTPESPPPIRNISFGKHKGYPLTDKTTTMISTAPCKINGNLCASGVLRWDFNEDKTIRQVHFKNGKWHKGALKVKPTPIYKAHEIEQSHDEQLIIIVEGEKCMNSLQDAWDEAAHLYNNMPKAIVTANIGGSTAVTRADWSPVGNRPVLVFPDQDAPGKKFGEYLHNKLENVDVINIPTSGKDPDGFDVADWLARGNDVRLLNRMTPQSFEEEFPNIRTDALAIASSIPPDDMKRVKLFLTKCAENGLDSLVMYRVIDTLKERTGLSKEALRKTHNDAKKGIHWDKRIVSETVKNYFNGHCIYSTGTFFGWCGTHWQEVDELLFDKHLMQTAEAIVPPETLDLAKQTKDANYVATRLLTEPGDPLGLTKAKDPVINCTNGELHLDPETGKIDFRPHDPGSFLTHCLNVKYDPDAKCPRFERSIDDVFLGRENLIRHFYEICGYIIQPNRFLKNFFLGRGRKGGNGKTTVFRVVRALIGEDAVASEDLDGFGENKHDTAKLVGKILLLDDDLQKGTKLSDGLLKKLSEQKTLTIEKKYQDATQIVSNVAVVMLTNNWPTTTDLTGAMVSRARVIPFDAHFGPKDEETDPFMFQNIIDNELPGVLNLFLSGFQRLAKRGYWDEPQECIDAKNEWFQFNNNLYAFASDVLIEDEDECIYSRELRMAYESWCDMEGISKRWRTSNRKMKSAFRDMEFAVSEKTNNNWGKWKINGYRLAIREED